MRCYVRLGLPGRSLRHYRLCEEGPEQEYGTAPRRRPEFSTPACWQMRLLKLALHDPPRHERKSPSYETTEIMNKPMQFQEWSESLDVPYGPYRAVIERVLDGNTVHVVISLGLDEYSYRITP